MVAASNAFIQSQITPVIANMTNESPGAKIDKHHLDSVVGVMKMGNNVPRAGLKPTSLAFRASVLQLHHVGFPDVSTIPTPTCLYSSLPQRSVQTTTSSSAFLGRK